jgi:hypothetical protein
LNTARKRKRGKRKKPSNYWDYPDTLVIIPSNDYLSGAGVGFENN